ncbi:unnamed protein product [Boreogadus saida]
MWTRLPRPTPQVKQGLPILWHSFVSVLVRPLPPQWRIVYVLQHQPPLLWLILRRRGNTGGPQALWWCSLSLGPCGGVLSARGPRALWWCSLSQGPSGPVVVFSQPGTLWWCSLSLGPVVVFSQPGPRGVLSAWDPVVFSQPGPRGGVLSAWAPWWCSLSLGPVVVFSQPGPCGGVLSAWGPWWCSLSLGPVVVFSRPGAPVVFSRPLALHLAGGRH